MSLTHSQLLQYICIWREVVHYGMASVWCDCYPRTCLSPLFPICMLSPGLSFLEICELLSPTLCQATLCLSSSCSIPLISPSLLTDLQTQIQRKATGLFMLSFGICVLLISFNEPLTPDDSTQNHHHSSLCWLDSDELFWRRMSMLWQGISQLDTHLKK